MWGAERVLIYSSACYPLPVPTNPPICWLSNPRKRKRDVLGSLRRSNHHSPYSFLLFRRPKAWGENAPHSRMYKHSLCSNTQTETATRRCPKLTAIWSRKEDNYRFPTTLGKITAYARGRCLTLIPVRLDDALNAGDRRNEWTGTTACKLIDRLFIYNPRKI